MPTFDNGPYDKEKSMLDIQDGVALIDADAAALADEVLEQPVTQPSQREPEDVMFVPSINFVHGSHTITLRACTVCAATVVDDPRDSGALLRRHAEWHELPARDGSNSTPDPAP